MAVHPPSTTHRQLDQAAAGRGGIREGLVRVSVGLEDVDDLITDFDTAWPRLAPRSRPVGLGRRPFEPSLTKQE